MVKAGDKFYLFWLQDIPSRSAENRAAVVYAFSDDGANFTDPRQLVPESENQTHDNGIDVCVDDGKIYVCWQDAAKTFASNRPRCRIIFLQTFLIVRSPKTVYRSQVILNPRDLRPSLIYINLRL